MKPIFLIGYMGCGKTTVGVELARQTGLEFIDLDDFIQQKEGMTIEEIFDKKGEKEFRKLETAALEEVAKKHDVVIGCGGGTPCHGFNIELMLESGPTIWLKSDLERLIARLLLPQEKAKRPRIAYLADEDVLPLVERELEERSPSYNQAKFYIDSSGIDTAEGLERTIKEIAYVLMLDV